MQSAGVKASVVRMETKACDHDDGFTKRKCDIYFVLWRFDNLPILRLLVFLLLLASVVC